MDQPSSKTSSDLELPSEELSADGTDKKLKGKPTRVTEEEIRTIGPLLDAYPNARQVAVMAGIKIGRVVAIARAAQKGLSGYSLLAYENNEVYSDSVI